MKLLKHAVEIAIESTLLVRVLAIAHGLGVIERYAKLLALGYRRLDGSGSEVVADVSVVS